jgi:hypothetical protein
MQSVTRLFRCELFASLIDRDSVATPDGLDKFMFLLCLLGETMSKCAVKDNENDF